MSAYRANNVNALYRHSLDGGTTT